MVLQYVAIGVTSCRHCSDCTACLEFSSQGSDHAVPDRWLITQALLHTRLRAYVWLSTKSSRMRRLSCDIPQQLPLMPTDLKVLSYQLWALGRCVPFANSTLALPKTNTYTLQGITAAPKLAKLS